MYWKWETGNGTLPVFHFRFPTSGFPLPVSHFRFPTRFQKNQPLPDLNENNYKKLLNFLPSLLPENIYLILSTSGNKRNFIEKFLTEKLDTHAANSIVEMGQVSKQESQEILLDWFKDSWQIGTPENKFNLGQILLQQFLDISSHVDDKEQPTILRLKLLYFLAKQLKSFTILIQNPAAKIHRSIENLPKTSINLIKYIFTSLEYKYEANLVKHFFSYMLANNKSITDACLEDLMTLEIHQQDTDSNKSRIKASAFIARMRYDLIDFIAIKYYPELTLFIDVKQFWQVTEELYFSDQNFSKKIYQNLVKWHTGYLSLEYSKLNINLGHGQNENVSLPQILSKDNEEGNSDTEPQSDDPDSAANSTPNYKFKYDVLISLNVGSMGDQANKLKNKLKHKGLKVWICTDMSAGVDWRDELTSAIKQTKIVILMINEKWCHSAECKDEFNYAKRLYLSSYEKKTSAPPLPRVPILTPLLFPDVVIENFSHVESLAANTNFINIKQQHLSEKELGDICKDVLGKVAAFK